MGRLRVVPKEKPLQFVEVQGVERNANAEQGRAGVVVRCRNLQMEIPPDVDANLLRVILGILGDQPC